MAEKLIASFIIFIILYVIGSFVAAAYVGYRVYGLTADALRAEEIENVLAVTGGVGGAVLAFFGVLLLSKIIAILAAYMLALLVFVLALFGFGD